MRAVSATIRSSTIAGNQGRNGGGGVFAGNLLTLDHSTISGNSAITGGGILLEKLTTVLQLTNSIVAANTASQNGPDLFVASSTGTVTSGANLIGNLAQAGTFTGPQPLTGDAKLMPLGAYGGPTQTMPPLAGSPAIDAGATTSTFTTDQRGFPRVVDGNNSGGAQHDLRAVEAAFRFVTTDADAGPGSLRHALADSAAISGFEAVAFAANLNGGTISLNASGPSALSVSDTDGVSIDASGLSNGLTITKPAAGSYRLLRLFTGALSLHHLTLTGGNPSGPGGAIASNGSLVGRRPSLAAADAGG